MTHAEEPRFLGLPQRWPGWWYLAGLALGVVVTLLASALVAWVTDPDALEPGPLVVLSGRDDGLGGQRQELVDQWNALHPRNQARIVELPPIADAQRAEMLARAQADDTPVDVFNLDVTWTAEFAEAGYLRSVDEARVPTTGFLRGPLSTCRYAGQLWALPFNADVGLLYYRTDLLAEIGQRDPPRDWDTLVADAVAVRTKKGAAVVGYVGQLDDYEGLTVTALEMIWGAGGTVVDDDGTVLPHGDIAAVRIGLDRLRNLSPSDTAGLDEAGSRQRFRTGQALFMRNWPLAYRAIGQGPQEGPVPPFDIAPLPSGSGALGGQNLAVAQRSTRPRAAAALVEFLTSERSEQLLFERGGLPATRTVVYTDPQVRAKFPFVDKLRTALDTAHHRPAVPYYAPFSAAFRDAVNGYLRGDPLDEDALRGRLEAALKGR